MGVVIPCFLATVLLRYTTLQGYTHIADVRQAGLSTFLRGFCIRKCSLGSQSATYFL